MTGLYFLFVQSVFVFVGLTLVMDRLRALAETERSLPHPLTRAEVGLYKLISLDPWLESAWFQPLSL
jgi:hypothetical protein